MLNDLENVAFIKVWDFFRGKIFVKNIKDKSSLCEYFREYSPNYLDTIINSNITNYIKITDKGWFTTYYIYIIKIDSNKNEYVICTIIDQILDYLEIMLLQTPLILIYLN